MKCVKCSVLIGGCSLSFGTGVLLSLVLPPGALIFTLGAVIVAAGACAVIGK